MNSSEVELAMVKHLGWRGKLIVPNVSWGLDFKHELDLCVLSKAGFLTEIEIKVSASDLRADLKKSHCHMDKRIQWLWFAMPIDLAAEHADLVPVHAGIYSIDDNSRVSVVRPATKQEARKLKPNEVLKLHHLAAMRIWPLKEDLLNLRVRLLKTQVNSESCTWTYDQAIDGWQTDCGETYLRQDDAILPAVPRERGTCEFCGRETK